MNKYVYSLFSPPAGTEAIHEELNLRGDERMDEQDQQWNEPGTTFWARGRSSEPSTVTNNLA